MIHHNPYYFSVQTNQLVNVGEAEENKIDVQGKEEKQDIIESDIKNASYQNFESDIILQINEIKGISEESHLSEEKKVNNFNVESVLNFINLQDLDNCIFIFITMAKLIQIF